MNWAYSRRAALLFMSAFALETAACADSGSSSPPASGRRFDTVGVRTMATRLDALYGDKTRSGQLAGINILVIQDGKKLYQRSFGYADLGTQRTLKPDDIFRLYSMTKPIAAVALMMLFEEGRFMLDDPIGKYLPEFGAMRVLRKPDSPITDTEAAVRQPTIHDLLRHTAGFSHGGGTRSNAADRAYIEKRIFALDMPLAESVRRLAAIPLVDQPGTRFRYSIAPDVEARLVEVISGEPFETFIQRRIFVPLGMADTGYHVDAARRGRLVALHWGEAGALKPCDDQHGCPPPVSFLQQKENIQSYTADILHKGGSYGLAGTIDDYARFAEMLANGGNFNGRQLIGARTIAYMSRDHLDRAEGAGRGKTWGLGFEVLEDAAEAGVPGEAGTFYWAGAGGTLFWVDPVNQLVVVAMTQHMGTHGVDDWQTIRAEMAAVIYGALP